MFMHAKVINWKVELILKQTNLYQQNHMRKEPAKLEAEKILGEEERKKIHESYLSFDLQIY